jgi:hypothetical protein
MLTILSSTFFLGTTHITRLLTILYKRYMVLKTGEQVWCTQGEDGLELMQWMVKLIQIIRTCSKNHVPHTKRMLFENF